MEGGEDGEGCVWTLKASRQGLPTSLPSPSLLQRDHAPHPEIHPRKLKKKSVCCFSDVHEFYTLLKLSSFGCGWNVPATEHDKFHDPESSTPPMM